jgi:hypothetical protein
MHNRLLSIALVAIMAFCGTAVPAQDKPSSSPPEKSVPPDTKPPDRPGAEYSGMYSFLKEGEFVQVSVEEEGRVTGFVSRYGDQDSDKGAFLDQFFKSGKLEGKTLAFTTEVVHGTAFDFKGAIERGEGKKPGDEAYYVLKGTLTERVTDVNQKQSSKSREVTLKAFPAEASAAPPPRD